MSQPSGLQGEEPIDQVWNFIKDVRTVFSVRWVAYELGLNSYSVREALRDLERQKKVRSAGVRSQKKRYVVSTSYIRVDCIISAD